MVIALLWNVSGNREITDSFNGGKKQKRDILRRVLLGQGKQVDI